MRSKGTSLPIAPLRYSGSKDASYRAMFELFAAAIGRSRPIDALDELSRSPGAVSKGSRKLSPQDRRYAHNAFNYLLRQKYIAYEERTGSIVLIVTPKGARRLEVKRLEAMTGALAAKKPASWDGRWRLILFDIPAAERAKRNAFRTFIRKLGAIMLQKSVWVYPYDCSMEIGELTGFFGLSDEQLRVVIATDIRNDGAIRRHFNLRM